MPTINVKGRCARQVWPHRNHVGSGASKHTWPHIDGCPSLQVSFNYPSHVVSTVDVQLLSGDVISVGGKESSRLGDFFHRRETPKGIFALI